MIERERGNFILNEAKNIGDALASARLFNELQGKISRSQPIDEFLNNFCNKNLSKE